MQVAMYQMLNIQIYSYDTYHQIWHLFCNLFMRGRSYQKKYLSYAVAKFDFNDQEAFKISQLQAMALIKQSLQEIPSKAIANCWCKTGLIDNEWDLTMIAR